MQERFRNQRGLLDGQRLADTKFVVIGAGAIGSFFVTTLAKMGAKHITVYDNDTIEDHNIANQIFPEDSIGESKVSALRRMANDFGGTLIEVKNERWHPENAIDGDIIVSAVDNMDARIAFWKHYSTRPVKFFIDGRMAAQVWRVYGVDMTSNKEKEFYATTLYPQSEAEQERCGHKSIIYTVLSVASEMLAQVKRYLMSEYRPTEVLYDALNCDTRKKYFMDLKMEVIEAEDEVAV